MPIFFSLYSLLKGMLLIRCSKKQNNSDREQTGDCKGWGSGEGIDYKAVKQTLWGDGNVLCFNCSGDYIGTYACVCLNTSNCTLKLGKLSYSNYASINLVIRKINGPGQVAQ